MAEGLELAEVVTASCAVAMFATQNSAADVIKSFFMKIFTRWFFKIVIGCGVRDLREAARKWRDGL